MIDVKQSSDLTKLFNTVSKERYSIEEKYFVEDSDEKT
jgi:hypothetical protein